MRAAIFAILLTNFACLSGGHEILIAAPVASKALHNVLCGLAKALTGAGSTVTLLTSHAPTFSNANLKIVKIIEGVPLLEGLNQFDVNTTSLNEYMTQNMETTAKSMWEMIPVKNLFKNRNNFDAIITPIFLNELAFPFLMGYNGSYITMYTPGVEQHIATLGARGRHGALPYLDQPFYAEYSALDKFLYTFHRINQTHAPRPWQYPPAHDVVRQFKPKIGDFQQYYERSDSMLVSGTAWFAPQRPLPPGHVLLDGLGARPARPLAQEVEEFIRSTSSDVVVYFSLGGTSTSEEMPATIKEVMLGALGQLPYAVLWSYAGVDVKLPANVMARKFMPQNDILGDPRTRVFISHCAEGSVTEATLHGVPVLALPVALDQHATAARLARHGLAIVMDWRTINIPDVMAAVRKLVEADSYRSRMLNISVALNEQKDVSAALAPVWIDHVIRHQSAPLRHDVNTLPRHGGVNAPPRHGGGVNVLCGHHSYEPLCDDIVLKLWAGLIASTGAVAGVTVTLLCCCLNTLLNNLNKPKLKKL